jgi:hypothetical protein
MRDNFTNVQHRAIQYWFLDGLAEIGAGLGSLLLAILFLFWRIALQTRWGLLIFFMTAFAVALGLRLVIQKVKEKDTYPRTGYVAPLSGMENKRALMIMIVFTVLLLIFNYYLTVHEQMSLLWSSGVSALIFAFVFAWTGYLTALRRLYFLALFSLLIGAVLVILGIGYPSGMAIITGLNGVILLFFGIQARRAYLRLNPPPTGK